MCSQHGTKSMVNVILLKPHVTKLLQEEATPRPVECRFCGWLDIHQNAFPTRNSFLKYGWFAVPLSVVEIGLNHHFFHGNMKIQSWGCWKLFNIFQISPCWNGFSATGGVVASQQMGVATLHWPSSVRPSPDSFRVYTLPISSFPDSTFWSAEIGWVNRLHSYSLFQNKMMCSPTWTCLWWPPWFCPKIPHTWIHWFYIIISRIKTTKIWI